MNDTPHQALAEAETVRLLKRLGDDPRNRTKDGVAVRVGQIWRDLRHLYSANRLCKVVAVDHGVAMFQWCMPNGAVLCFRPIRALVSDMHVGAASWSQIPGRTVVIDENTPIPDWVALARSRAAIPAKLARPVPYIWQPTNFCGR